MKYLKINSLEKGWQEWDELMLHAAFQCLVNFMEKDDPGIVYWDSTKKMKKVWIEIQELYKWWTKERPEREKNIELSMSDESDKEDQKNFQRLIKIRGYLWT